MWSGTRRDALWVVDVVEDDEEDAEREAEAGGDQVKHADREVAAAEPTYGAQHEPLAAFERGHRVRCTEHRAQSSAGVTHESRSSPEAEAEAKAEAGSKP